MTESHGSRGKLVDPGRVKILPKLAYGAEKFSGEQHGVVAGEPVDGAVFQRDVGLTRLFHFYLQFRFQQKQVLILVMEDGIEGEHIKGAVPRFDVRVTGRSVARQVDH
jgi:hypothetical protein